MTTETTTHRPTHRVYAVIIKKEGAAKAAWLEIGAAWAHRDGKRFSLKLDSLPRTPDAQLVIRTIEPRRAGRRLRQPRARSISIGKVPKSFPESAAAAAASRGRF